MKGAIIPCSPPVCHSLDWKKQLAQATTNPVRLLEQLKLSNSLPDQGKAESLFSLRVPQPFIDRMEPGNPDDPLFLQVWPANEEFQQQPGFEIDPLKEASTNPVPGLLHKYGKRVLTISAASCAINCRYCFRRHFNYREQAYNDQAWDEWIAYIKQHPEIDEIILSGGEPLLMPDEKLIRLHRKLETLPQLKRLRIHSRLPLVIPSRITTAFCNLAKNSRFQWVLVWHINHPNEIDDAVTSAFRQCHNAGIRQFNQSVLLKRVNDNAESLCQLSEKLFAHFVQPYYLHLLDRVTGTHHFEVSFENAERIYSEMLSQLPGYLVPKLVREEPGKTSKSPITLNVV